MRANVDQRAFEALSQHPRRDDLAAIAHWVMVDSRKNGDGTSRQARIAELATERKLTREDAETPFGNALDVLARGPDGDDQRALAHALAAHGLAAQPPESHEDEATAVLWLAAHTPLDATGLLDLALGDTAPAMWTAIAERIRQIAGGHAGPLGRGEALLAAVALASSQTKAASELSSTLAGEVQDDKIARALGSRPLQAALPALAGEMVPRPRGAIATAALALTGVALVMHLGRWLARWALAYRTPAEVGVSEDGGVRVKWRVLLLGRTLSDRDVVVPRAGLVRATRDVRYPRVALYAALLALAVGSYVGVWAFVDGVRAASPSLLATGLAIVALGLAVDFVLSTLVPGARGRCRLVFTARDGSPICIGAIDIASADALLARLAEP